MVIFRSGIGFIAVTVDLPPAQHLHDWAEKTLSPTQASSGPDNGHEENLCHFDDLTLNEFARAWTTQSQSMLVQH